MFLARGWCVKSQKKDRESHGVPAPGFGIHDVLLGVVEASVNLFGVLSRERLPYSTEFFPSL
jgi:hypothetical protein